MTEPLLRRLDQRGERLTVAALPWVAPVYRAMPQVDEVLELPFAHGGLQWKVRRTLAKAWRGRFDKAYVCPNSFKSALLPWWAGIPERMGYLGEQRYGLLTHRLDNPSKQQRPAMVDFYTALAAEPQVHDSSPKVLPQLQLAPEFVQQSVVQYGLHAGGYVVFAPGAEYGPAKRWPAHHFVSLALHLQRPVVLLGSTKEHQLCDQIAAAVDAKKPHHCINLAGKTGLSQAFALIAAAHAVVSNDSGLMHVAAALGVQQVALFGSSSPLHTPPLNPKAQVIWLKNSPYYEPPLDCAPCFARECPLQHTRCLQDILPTEVARYV
jgi:heptosyltransferase II